MISVSPLGSLASDSLPNFTFTNSRTHSCIVLCVVDVLNIFGPVRCSMNLARSLPIRQLLHASTYRTMNLDTSLMSHDPNIFV